MQRLNNEFIVSALFVFVVTCAALLLLKKIKESRNLPPGPWGLPFVGYLPFLFVNPHLKVTELSKKYGNVFSLNIGTSNVVFLNDLDSVKDAYSKNEFLGRPEQLRETGLFRYEKGILTESGQFWKEQRRFAFKTLRDLGFGKQVMESNIKDEISYLIREIEKQMNAPVNIHQLLTPSVSNNICYLVFGHRHDYDDPERELLDIFVADVSSFLNMITVLGVQPLMNFCIKLFSFVIRKSRMIKSFRQFEDMIDKAVENHRHRLQDGNAMDYIDSYLLEMRAREKRNDVGSFTVDVMNSNVRDFFSAGSETARTTLDWMLKLVSTHPDIQKAVQNEVDSVVGSNRLPSWSDRELMPFTQAVILETLRWASVVPLNIPRLTLANTSVSGHFIPKNTVIIANFWAINRDEKLWRNPKLFLPQRFLTKCGKLKENEATIPFGFGKRTCVGEILAKFELFLYFTTIMQKFTISVPDGVTPSFDSRLGVTLQPIQPPILNFRKR